MQYRLILQINFQIPKKRLFNTHYFSSLEELTEMKGTAMMNYHYSSDNVLDYTKCINRNLSLLNITVTRKNVISTVYKS